MITTTYCAFVFRISKVRLVAAVLGAVTVAALSVLPSEHLHTPTTSGSTHTVVHRHDIVPQSHHAGSSLDHGDHLAARFLISVFDTISKFAPNHALMMASVVAIVPSSAILGLPATSDNRPIHGPPKSPLPARAPPIRV